MFVKLSQGIFFASITHRLLASKLIAQKHWQQKKEVLACTRIAKYQYERKMVYYQLNRAFCTFAGQRHAYNDDASWCTGWSSGNWHLNRRSLGSITTIVWLRSWWNNKFQAVKATKLDGYLKVNRKSKLCEVFIKNRSQSYIIYPNKTSIKEGLMPSFLFKTIMYPIM